MRRSRRIVQRIENQRWVYYVQKRCWLFFYCDAEGPFTTHAAATEAVTLMRARDEYGGHIPWEPAYVYPLKESKRAQAATGEWHLRRRKAHE